MKMKRTVWRLAAVFVLGLLIWGRTTTDSVIADGDEDSVLINETNFPDANFRDILTEMETEKAKENSVFTADVRFTAEELQQITDMDIGDKSICNLQGIEYFTALKSLDCSENQLTTLDVSKNTELESLNCYATKLETLDVSKNTKLVELYCGYNQLTTLDLRKNTKLKDLSCEDNQLTALDLSKNTALDSLDCFGNSITNLDLSNNTAMTSLNCGGNDLTSLNVSKNTSLEELNCSGNKLTSLNVSNNTKLYYLSCAINQLTSLDVSKNTALEELYCGGNSLTTLDVSNNAKLEKLDCDSGVTVYRPHTHTGTLHTGKAATCGEAGEKSYYTCTCGKAFEDAACTKEITDPASWKVIAATGKHTLKTTTKKATRKKNGSVKTACTVCGKVTEEKTISYPKTIKLSKNAYTYDGRKKKPSVKVTDAAGNKVSSGNYTVTYDSGRKNVGKYTVTVTFKGNYYSGTKKLAFRINPKGTSISKITAGKKKLTVKWKKQAKQTTGYQIQVSLKKSFPSKKTKTVTVKKAKTTSKVIKGLKGKKKYYVRIRTYKTVKGTKYTSSWSKVKNATTKK